MRHELGRQERVRCRRRRRLLRQLSRQKAATTAAARAGGEREPESILGQYIDFLLLLPSLALSLPLPLSLPLSLSLMLRNPSDDERWVLVDSVGEYRRQRNTV